MKLPKLKYYYLALTPDQYQEFESSRRLTVSDNVSIDIETGAVTGRSLWIVCARPSLADDVWRSSGLSGASYVLRIPAACVDRGSLTPTEVPEVFEYRATLHIPHCGVERFESALSDFTIAVA